MFACLVLAIIAGFPVAFSIAGVAAVFGIIGVEHGDFTPAFLLAAPIRIEGFFDNENVLAIPLFLFMGMLLERTHIAEDMLLALDRLMGGVRGGMAYAAVLVGACIAAITGFVSASVIAIALIALPAMLKRGYDPKLAAGVVAASGTLAQILPPSIVLIVLSDQLEVPLLAVYRGALLPSALLVGLYLLYIFARTHWQPRAARATSARGPDQRSREGAWGEAIVAAGLPLGIILLVLASVYFAVAAPTESGAIGVVATLLLGIARRKLDWKNLRQAMETTGILCSCILFLLFGASFFTLVLRGMGGQEWIE